MEMKKINSGKLRAIGYDVRSPAAAGPARRRQHAAIQRRRRGSLALSSSGAAWSYYRDNIEEEFTAKRDSAHAPAGKNPLDELFGKP